MTINETTKKTKVLKKESILKFCELVIFLTTQVATFLYCKRCTVGRYTTTQALNWLIKSKEGKKEEKKDVEQYDLESQL